MVGAMVVWERPEPPERPAPAPLSRERIVRAAIRLADADGLEAVSLRKVAAVLEVGPMRLYGYIATKEELLDLMVDAVYAEIRPSGGDWREALRSLADATRRAAQRHEWFADLIGGRPQLGPNTLAAGDAVVAAMGDVGLDVVVPAVAAVRAYVIGAVRREVAERRAERESGMDIQEFQAAHGPYLQRVFEAGRFPALGRMVREGPHLGEDETFWGGLEFLLEGIGMHVEAHVKGPRERPT
jgi:AcrR family transcriptional regulator